MKIQHIYIVAISAICGLLMWYTSLYNGSIAKVIFPQTDSANFEPAMVTSLKSVRCGYVPAADRWESIPISTHREIFRSTGSYLSYSSSSSSLCSTIGNNGSGIALLSDASVRSYGGSAISGAICGSSATMSSASVPFSTGGIRCAVSMPSTQLSPLSNSRGFTTVASVIGGGELTEEEQAYLAPRRSPGVPDTAPVGDAVVPLLLLACCFLYHKRRVFVNNHSKR